MIRLGLLVLVALSLASDAQQLKLPMDADYRLGLNDLDARRWDAAINHFEAAAGRNKTLEDAALYWKAYALSHAGRLQDSLAATALLQKSFPMSRWLNDAKALTVEVQADSGHPVYLASETDEDVKILALNTLMQKNPKVATPVLMQIIDSGASDKTKGHALFVLAQSSDPEARNTVIEFAQKPAHPVLQTTAIRIVGMMGGEGAGQQLTALYRKETNDDVRRVILDELIAEKNSGALSQLAREEKSPRLKSEILLRLSQLAK